MSRKISVFFFTSFFLFHSALSAKPYAPKTESIRIKSFQLEGTGSMFTTTGNFDIDGEKIPLDETTDFQKIDLDMLLRYGYGHQLELRGGGRFRMVQSLTEEIDVTNSAIESFVLGAKYSLKPKAGSNWKFAVDFELRNTFYTNETYASGEVIPDDEIVLGDSGTSFMGGVHASYSPSSKSYILSGSGFFHRPPNNLSAEIITHLELMIPFTKLAIGGGVDSVFSLEQDEFTSAPFQKPRLATGATTLFNSINRSFMAPYFKVYYSFNELALFAQIGSTISGTSTDEGNLIAGGFVWNWGGVDPNKARVQRFKEYNIEASVIQVSPRGKFIKIDKGIAQGVEKGARFDIYETDFFGGNTLIATGIIFEVNADAAIVRLDRMLENKEVKTGATARGR